MEVSQALLSASSFRSMMVKLSFKIQTVKWSDDPIPNNFGPGFDYLRILEEAEKKKKLLEEKLAAQREKEALEKSAEEDKNDEEGGDGDGDKNGEKKDEEKDPEAQKEQQDVTVVRFSSDLNAQSEQSIVSGQGIEGISSEQSLVST